MTIEFTIEAEAHCDGPCGVYDPASARVAGEAVQSMTNKMIALAENHGTDCNTAAYLNTMSRYAAIKEICNNPEMLKRGLPVPSDASGYIN